MEIFQPDGSSYVTENTGSNDQWGKILAELLVGFAGGYYDSTPVSINPQIEGTIDLNNSINWDPTYAFGTITPTPTFQTNDPYAKFFFEKTNSYGAGYSDALMAAYTSGGPQLSVAQGVTNVVSNNGTTNINVISSNVPVLNLTIFADGENPRRLYARRHPQLCHTGER